MVRLLSIYSKYCLQINMGDILRQLAQTMMFFAEKVQLALCQSSFHTYLGTFVFYLLHSSLFNSSSNGVTSHFQCGMGQFLSDS